MPVPQAKWARAPGDLVKHYYLPFNGEWVPCCDRNGSNEKTVAAGGTAPKCVACELNEKGC